MQMKIRMVFIVSFSLEPAVEMIFTAGFNKTDDEIFIGENFCCRSVYFFKK